MQENYEICERCGGKMRPARIKKEITIDGTEYQLKNIECFQCECCEEIYYSPKQEKKLQRLIKNFQDKLESQNVDSSKEEKK